MNTNSTSNVTHNNLPEATALAITLLKEIKDLLLQKDEVGSKSKPVSTAELCQFLGISVPTAIRWRKKGKIPFYTIGTAVRYDLPKVIESLENRREKK